MFNPTDPYYIGTELPSIGAFVIGFALVLLFGWWVERGKKK